MTKLLRREFHVCYLPYTRHYILTRYTSCLELRKESSLYPKGSSVMSKVNLFSFSKTHNPLGPQTCLKKKKKKLILKRIKRERIKIRSSKLLLSFYSLNAIALYSLLILYLFCGRYSMIQFLPLSKLGYVCKLSCWLKSAFQGK